MMCLKQLKMNDKLKEIIFNKLYEDLRYVEIIPYKESIWFIDRKENYWYFEYEKSGSLWYKGAFFTNFFPLFSLERNEYRWILAEWVEEVLNCKIETSIIKSAQLFKQVEEVLNCKVEIPRSSMGKEPRKVEEVLNCKVMRSISCGAGYSQVKEVLAFKVESTRAMHHNAKYSIDDVLNNS